MCLGEITQEQQEDFFLDFFNASCEVTPRGGDSAKKRRLSESEALAISQAQELGLDDLDEPISQDAFGMSALAKSLPSSPASSPVSRAHRMVIDEKDPVSRLRKNEHDIVAEACGRRAEFRTGKRTASDRRSSAQNASQPKASPLRLGLRLPMAPPKNTVGPVENPAKYTVQQLLGEGACGKVQKGIDNENNTPVAIKTLYRQAEDTCLHESSAMQACQHPNVLQLRDSFETANGSTVLVMDLASCDLLQHLQERGPLSEEEACRKALGVVSAVAATHQAGYCHRDIKLENILIRADSQDALLGDFGTASPLQSPTGSRAVLQDAVGSQSYMAPEVVAIGEGTSCAGYDGAATDVWSAGVVLYTMVAGEFAFEVASPENMRYERFMQGRSDPGEFDWPPQFSALLIDLLQKMMAPANQRLSAVEALAHPWFQQAA